MISLANSHWLWISNNILARSEKSWLHLKNTSVLVCDFQCQQGKRNIVSLSHRLKGLFISSDLYFELVGLSNVRKKKCRQNRTNLFKPHCLWLKAPRTPQIFYYVPASTQPYCATSTATVKTYLDILTFYQYPGSLRGYRNLSAWWSYLVISQKQVIVDQENTNIVSLP